MWRFVLALQMGAQSNSTVKCTVNAKWARVVETLPVLGSPQIFGDGVVVLLTQAAQKLLTTVTVECLVVVLAVVIINGNIVRGLIV